jgi:hypothetical protein
MSAMTEERHGPYMTWYTWHTRAETFVAAFHVISVVESIHLRGVDPMTTCLAALSSTPCSPSRHDLARRPPPLHLYDRHDPHPRTSHPKSDARAPSPVLPQPPPMAHTTTRDTGNSTKKERPSVTIVSAQSGSDRTLGEQKSFSDVPPPLSYSIKENGRERKILIWFTLFFFEAGVLPLILFFSLRWGAHLSITTNLAIITSLIGSVSGYKFANRSWTLWYGKDHHTYRPIGAGRWGLDSFQ